MALTTGSNIETIKTLDHILDLETLFGYQMSKVNWSNKLGISTPYYGWGDHSEVLRHINKKDRDQQFRGHLYTIEDGLKVPIGQAPKKYPLIWLVGPFQGKFQNGQHIFKNIRIIVAKNTNSQDLNPQRWSDNIPFVQSIGNTIIGDLKSGKYISLVDSQIYKYSNRPFYSVSETGDGKDKSKAIDWWDAFVIDVDLKAKQNCREKEYLEKYCINYQKEKLCH